MLRCDVAHVHAEMGVRGSHTTSEWHSENARDLRDVPEKYIGRAERQRICYISGQHPELVAASDYISLYKLQYYGVEGMPL